jgi:transcription elongation factor GreB
MTDPGDPKPDLDDDLPAEPALPAGTKNYITPGGAQHLRDERQRLRAERATVVQTVEWAAGNGDRSENGDYIYGKRRLREIDRRLRFLARRLEAAEIVEPRLQTRRDQIFFGATVTYVNSRDERRTVTIVGVDEIDPDLGRISWVAPLARALRTKRIGDIVDFATPEGLETVEILAIQYPDAA